MRVYDDGVDVDRPFRLASSIFSHTLMEQRHRQKLANLEREMMLEMERQKDELNQQLEAELQTELQVG